MLAPSSANMIRTGMLMSATSTSTPTTSAPGNATSAKKIEYAIVDPTGAEMTALKMVASTADAERTSPVLLRTNSLLAVAIATLRRSHRHQLDMHVEIPQSLNTIEHDCQGLWTRRDTFRSRQIGRAS